MIFMCLASLSYSQIDTNIVLQDRIDSTYKEPVWIQMKAGSCGSPDGPMNSIPGPPSSYAWLQNNGYCNPAAYGTNPTVCWTFTPTSSSVTINSGYSQSGCFFISFGPFTLYDAGCSVVGTGLNFTGLTPGIQYTWCLTGSAWGGGQGCTGFVDFCPYYTNNAVLPIELIDFYGVYRDGANNLSWITVSEINNSHFLIERSINGYEWDIIGTVPGAGNSSTGLVYDWEDTNFKDSLNYYRLTQVDFDGRSETFKMISIDNRIEKPVLYKRYNMMGQELTEDNFKYYSGIYIELYTNGTISKFLKHSDF